jgi:hypothetical protein
MGFRDGAGIRAYRKSGLHEEDYREGYSAGQKARREATDEYAKKVGYNVKVISLGKDLG